MRLGGGGKGRQSNSRSSETSFRQVTGKLSYKALKVPHILGNLARKVVFYRYYMRKEKGCNKPFKLWFGSDRSQAEAKLSLVDDYLTDCGEYLFSPIGQGISFAYVFDTLVLFNRRINPSINIKQAIGTTVTR